MKALEIANEMGLVKETSGYECFTQNELSNDDLIEEIQARAVKVCGNLDDELFVFIHYSYEEIVELEKSEPNKELRLHWECDNSDAAKVTPCRIIDDIKYGFYTPYEFDDLGYCISEQEYLKEQEEQRLARETD